MNMPSPMSHSNYDSINEVLHGAYETIAESSMANAAKEVRHALNNDASDNDILTHKFQLMAHGKKEAINL